uniref:alpha/beta fold hydrolase n=1 Tax=Herbidospora sakaeratensis TaxID=564415 RepID=UPI000780EC5C|nr:alpha/beta hydrolase [Herbidospora sakaeratensis]
MMITTSRDGTTLAYDQVGEGPPVIVVLGVFNERAAGLPLAEALADHFTVFVYDRRGRGGSGEVAVPYRIADEVDDLKAMIEVAGGEAAVFGYSSGGLLALKALLDGARITRLALYEPPYQNENPSPADHAGHLTELVSQGRRAEAVEYFQLKIIGMPPHMVEEARNAPFWRRLEDLAPSCVYDALLVTDRGLPAQLAALRPPPTLVLDGAASPDRLRGMVGALGTAVQGAQVVALDGQTHTIDPEVTGPIVRAFLTTGPSPRPSGSPS